MLYPNAITVGEMSTSETEVVPESYRPLIFGCVGVWGWVIVLSILSRQHIDVSALLHTTISSCQVRPLTILAVSLTLTILIHITLLEHTIFKQHTNIFNHFGPVVLCYGSATALALFGPWKKETEKFLKCFYRLFFQLHGHVYFSDILVADILISFSGVFTGIFIKLVDNTSVSYFRYVPYVNSIPYLIRLKQCLQEYAHSKDRNTRQLVNALKYTSAIPVIFLAHYTKLDDRTNVKNRFDLDLLRLWFLSAVVSGVFAFVWDIVMDWGLVQIEPGYATLRLRKDIYFSDPFVYIMAVSVNGLLRALKVFSHLHHIHPFCVDLSEVMRRWIWVIFRFEFEWVKRYHFDLGRNIETNDMVESKSHFITPHAQHYSSHEERRNDEICNI